MQPPVFFVVGKPQHGKSEIRKVICRLTGLRGESCSTVIDHVIAARRGVSVEKLREEPKEALRPLRIEVGDFLCGLRPEISEKPAVPEVDQEVYRIPSSLVRMLYLNGCNVIDGVRRRLELQHAQDHLDWNGVRSLVIFVDRPGGPEIKDNTEDLRPLADEVVVNDGTVEGLASKVEAILQKHFGVATPAVEAKEIVVQDAAPPVASPAPAPA